MINASLTPPPLPPGTALPFLVSGNTITLQDLDQWPQCVVHTCLCVPEFPVTIVHGMRERKVVDLRPGCTYTFEVCRQPRDSEDIGCCVASCDVLVPGQ